MTEFVIFAGVLAVLIVGLYIFLSNLAVDKAEIEQEKAVNETTKKAKSAKSSPSKLNVVRKKYTRK